MPSPTTPVPIKLIFTTTSLRNVTIATESDAHYYEVVTPAWEAGCTKIKRLASESGQMSLIAELKKDDGKSSDHTGLRFIVPETDFGSPQAFLGAVDKARKIFGNYTDLKGNKYQWRESEHSIQLVKIDEPDGRTVARFHRHHRHLGMFRMSEQPYLEVDPELVPSMDTFIVSFLLAEGKRRQ